MPIIHQGASEPTKLPPTQHITSHRSFIITIGLLPMLPCVIKLVETTPFVFIIIVLRPYNKQFKSKHGCHNQGKVTVNNLSKKGITSKPTNQATHKEHIVLSSIAKANAIDRTVQTFQQRYPTSQSSHFVGACHPRPFLYPVIPQSQTRLVTVSYYHHLHY